MATQERERLKIVLVLGGLTLLAVWMSLPRPVQLGWLALGAALNLLLVVLGLAAAAPFGKGAPLLSAWTQGRFSLRDARLLAAAFLGGAVLGAVLLGIIFLLLPMEPRLAARFAARAANPAWWPFAVAFEASVTEEVVFRLFLLSAMVWVLSRGWRKERSEASSMSVWMAVVVSTLAFAFVHLPGWEAVISATPLLIASVLALNGIAGLVLGQVYWRFGIEAAIACHCAGDLIVQGIGPRVLA
jgi:membrane protease YdiL (CAAX protease family)